MFRVENQRGTYIYIYGKNHLSPQNLENICFPLNLPSHCENNQAQEAYKFSFVLKGKNLIVELFFHGVQHFVVCISCAPNNPRCKTFGPYNKLCSHWEKSFHLHKQKSSIRQFDCPHSTPSAGSSSRFYPSRWTKYRNNENIMARFRIWESCLGNIYFLLLSWHIYLIFS